MPFGFYDETTAALPHPPIPLPVVLVVEEAIRTAWQILRSRAPGKFNLATAIEDEITHELHEILYNEVLAGGIVEGFDREHFTVVTREPKIRNFDGSNLDKMPDLVVGIAGREQIFMLTQDGLFVECKPVDTTHTVGVHYAAKGIARFVKGEYAWAMPTAMMIGYVDRGYALDPKLVETLKAHPALYHVLEHPQRCRRSVDSAVSTAVHTTRHGRPFRYVENGQPAPPIVLRHLWLNRG